MELYVAQEKIFIILEIHMRYYFSKAAAIMHIKYTVQYKKLFVILHPCLFLL
jgi:hypothetical protein